MSKMTTIKSIRIDSENVCYGPEPGYDDEVFQHLTINAKGRVWLTRYCYGDRTTGYLLKSRHYLSIPKEQAQDIFKAIIDGFFNDESEPIIVTDVGGWDMLVIEDTEETTAFTGSLINDGSVGHEVSKMIRKALNDNTILALDGDMTNDNE